MIPSRFRVLPNPFPLRNQEPHLQTSFHATFALFANAYAGQKILARLRRPSFQIGFASDLFLWFPVKGISVDIPCSGDIYFDVRVVHKRYFMSLFETLRNGVAVGRRFSFVGITSVKDLNGVTVVNRKLLGVEESEEFPSWLKRVDRELLGTPATAIQADITVLKDGNGTVKTIAEAIKKAPEQSSRRFVIDVKAGRYEEENFKTDTHSFHLRSDAPFFPQIALITLFGVKMMREFSAQV
ncbi:unnamed protein product [Brassica oleracea var. botrytis]